MADNKTKTSSRERILEEYIRMMQGETINFKEAMKEYQSTLKPIQVDFQFIRSLMTDYMPDHELYYDRKHNVHGIKNSGWMQPAEILAILKLIIGTRTFSKDELVKIQYDLIKLAPTDEQANLKKVLNNTLDKYIPISQRDDLVELIQSFYDYINAKKVIEFTYKSSRKDIDSTNLQVGVPYSLYFDRSYFYVMIYLIDQDESRIFRLDRFLTHRAKHRSFNIPAVRREDMGVAINRTYLLKMGNIIQYKFQYWDYPQTALDKLPGSKVDKKLTDSVIISGEMYSEGGLLWLLSQGNRIKVLEPQSLVNEVQTRLQRALDLYK